MNIIIDIGFFGVVTVCGQLFTARVQVLEHIVLESNARRSQVLTSDCRKHVPRTTATTMNSCSETSPNSPVVFAQTGGDQLLRILQIQALAKFWSEANKNQSPNHCSRICVLNARICILHRSTDTDPIFDLKID